MNLNNKTNMIRAELKNAKILIVDDQQANIDVLTDFLEMQGYTNLKQLIDSREVIATVADYKPDILLLDLTMPYLSGFDILQLLKENVSADVYLPVLVLTADITIESKRKALQLGASDFLTKPFDLIELQARVNTHLQIRFKNEQINEYAQQLEKLIATKDKFFSIIAHDLRNPFIGIENFIKILLKVGKFNQDEIRMQLETIYDSANQGHELLENLLRWARSQTNSISLNQDAFLLNETVANCLKLIEIQAKNKEVKLINNVSAEIIIDTDQDVLETILRNLISNAVKYTETGGKVVIEATKKVKTIEIAVTDSGVGIEPQAMEKLFRIDKNLQSKKGTSGEKGSGLGLILCQEFIEKLEGNIQVESEVGKGTTFTVCIPDCIVE